LRTVSRRGGYVGGIIAKVIDGRSAYAKQADKYNYSNRFISSNVLPASFFQSTQPLEEWPISVLEAPLGDITVTYPHFFNDSTYAIINI